eukprot:CAMPEP_0117455002 /NCGR_PEP_ID=MMETSP0759-20121206/11120_1 /TAXON_ID=63605 /ORGANISM="Percolomonas cosmopolitus, Strain WS" /LENGTH=308 /DNA_ID=CAMNT_0005248263 /DNA_START=744 /DNA_END=1671 /DNA_ORIENTATION=+
MSNSVHSREEEASSTCGQSMASAAEMNTVTMHRSKSSTEFGSEQTRRTHHEPTLQQALPPSPPPPPPRRLHRHANSAPVDGGAAVSLRDEQQLADLHIHSRVPFGTSTSPGYASHPRAVNVSFDNNDPNDMSLFPSTGASQVKESHSSDSLREEDPLRITPLSEDITNAIVTDAETQSERSVHTPSLSRENRRNSSSSSNGKATDCGICMDEFQIQGKLPCCDHFFCFECIQKWSQKANTCPLCVRRFNSITKQKLNPADGSVQKLGESIVSSPTSANHQDADIPAEILEIIRVANPIDKSIPNSCEY